MPTGEPLTAHFEWKTIDAHPHVRGARWYAIGGIVVLGGSAYGLVTGSFSTALVFLLIGALYFLLRNRPPREITVRLTSLGMEIAEEVIPWSEIREFWFLIGHEYCELHITPTARLQADRTILLRQEEVPDARAVLLTYLPERPGQQERPVDLIAKIFKL